MVSGGCSVCVVFIVFIVLCCIVLCWVVLSCNVLCLLCCVVTLERNERPHAGNGQMNRPSFPHVRMTSWNSVRGTVFWLRPISCTFVRSFVGG